MMMMTMIMLITMMRATTTKMTDVAPTDTTKARRNNNSARNNVTAMSAAGPKSPSKTGLLSRQFSSRGSLIGHKQVAWPPNSRLLEHIAIQFFDTAMNVPGSSKRRIRPSSAAANLQTHKKYTTSLYDDIWTQHTFAKLDAQRPKTQAGGSRDTSQVSLEEEQTRLGDDARRLTVADVDGIAARDGVNRILFSRATARTSLKEKWRISDLTKGEAKGEGQRVDQRGGQRGRSKGKVRV
ncbi:hypothetical protein LSAT2_022619 [Lamellibrachia satsuma]|nr:hypothetical protein LSAT2_022619 [Lamellibrachia satsuma]